MTGPLAVAVLNLGLLLLCIPRVVSAMGRRTSQVALAALPSALLLALWMPLSRWEALGHAAVYLDVSTGAADLSDLGPGYLAAPALAGYSALVGTFGAGSGALLALAMLSGALWAGCLSALAFRIGGSGTAVLALLLTTLEPQRLLWSHDAFHVIHPAALLALSTLAAWLASGRQETAPDRAGCRVCLLASALSFALALQLRVDVLVYAPVPLLLYLWPGRGNPRRLPAPLLLAMPFSLMVPLVQGGVLDHGGGDSLSYYLGVAMGHVSFAAPLGVWWLAGAICLAVLVARGRPFRMAPVAYAASVVLASGAVLAHLLLGFFNDFGSRHMLPARGFMLLAVSVVIGYRSPGSTWRDWLKGAAAPVLLVTGLLVWSAADMRTRYWADQDSWAHEVLDPLEIDVDLEQKISSGCLVITDNEPLWGRGVARSHANLVDRREALQLWEQHEGCVLWLRDLEDWRWTSLSVRDRALRLEHLWRWQAVGRTRLPGGAPAEVLEWVR